MALQFLRTNTVAEFKAMNNLSAIEIKCYANGNSSFSSDKIEINGKGSQAVTEAMQKKDFDSLRISRCKDVDSDTEFYMVHVAESHTTYTL